MTENSPWPVGRGGLFPNPLGGGRSPSKVAGDDRSLGPVARSAVALVSILLVVGAVGLPVASKSKFLPGVTVQAASVCTRDGDTLTLNDVNIVTYPFVLPDSSCTVINQNDQKLVINSNSASPLMSETFGLLYMYDIDSFQLRARTQSLQVETTASYSSDKHAAMSEKFTAVSSLEQDGDDYVLNLVVTPENPADFTGSDTDILHQYFSQFYGAVAYLDPTDDIDRVHLTFAGGDYSFAAVDFVVSDEDSGTNDHYIQTTVTLKDGVTLDDVQAKINALIYLDNLFVIAPSYSPTITFVAGSEQVTYKNGQVQAAPLVNATISEAIAVYTSDPVIVVDTDGNTLFQVTGTDQVITDLKVSEIIDYLGEGTASYTLTGSATDEADDGYTLTVAAGTVTGVVMNDDLTAAIEVSQALANAGHPEATVTDKNNHTVVTSSDDNQLSTTVTVADDDADLAALIAIASGLNKQVAVTTPDKQLTVAAETDGGVAVQVANESTSQTREQVLAAIDSLAESGTVSVSLDVTGDAAIAGIELQATDDDTTVTVVFRSDLGQKVDIDGVDNSQARNLWAALAQIDELAEIEALSKADHLFYTIHQDPYVETMTLVDGKLYVSQWQQDEDFTYENVISVDAYARWLQEVLVPVMTARATDQLADASLLDKFVKWLAPSAYAASIDIDGVVVTFDGQFTATYSATGTIDIVVAAGTASVDKVVATYQKILAVASASGVEVTFTDGNDAATQADSCSVFDGTCDLSPVVSITGNTDSDSQSDYVVRMDSGIQLADLPAELLSVDQKATYVLASGAVTSLDLEIEAGVVEAATAVAASGTSLAQVISAIRESVLVDDLSVWSAGTVVVADQPVAYSAVVGDYFSADDATFYPVVSLSIDASASAVPRDTVAALVDGVESAVVATSDGVIYKVEAGAIASINLEAGNLSTDAASVLAQVVTLAHQIDGVEVVLRALDDESAIDANGDFQKTIALADGVRYLAEALAQTQTAGSLTGLNFSIVGADFALAATNGGMTLVDVGADLSAALAAFDAVNAAVPVVSEATDILSDYGYTGTGVVTITAGDNGLVITLPDDANLTESQINDLFSRYVTSGHENFILNYHGQTYRVVDKRIYHASADSSSTSDHHVSGENVPNHARAEDAQPKVCSAMSPVGQPDVFEARAKGDTVRLYFVPTKDNTKGATVQYGFASDGVIRFSGINLPIDEEAKRGVNFVEIHDLDPDTEYFFEVAGTNEADGCTAIGSFSDRLVVKKAGRSGSTWRVTYKYH